MLLPMRIDTVKAYVKLRQKLIAEKADLEERLRDINLALGQSPAAEVSLAAPVGRPAEPILKRKRRLSPEGRRNIIAGIKARWARLRAQKAVASKPKRKVSPAARARLSALAKARWAKAKKAGRSRL